MFLKLQNSCRTVFKEIYSQDLVLEGNNSHFLIFMNWPWLIIQALELCQCASNFLHLCLKCTSQNIIHHTYYTLTKQIKSFLKGLFYLNSVIFLGLPFLLPNAILRTYVAQPNFNSAYYCDSHWSLNFTFFFMQCGFYWIKGFLNHIRVQCCTRQ